MGRSVPRSSPKPTPKPTPKPRSGLCPELLADFRIPKPPGCSQGAQRAVSCAVRVADFLAEGAGWGASPGRGGELGCQAKKVIAAVEFELKLLDQVEVSAVWIPHWHSEPFESQGTRAAKRYVNGNLVEREKHHLNLHLNLGVGCAPSCWPIFVPKPPGCSQG